MLLLFPLSFAIAILRYRLWDIDVFIRRTLIYSLLTAVLALVYLSSVVLLEQFLHIFAGRAQSEIVTIVSTLAIATLFTPLRQRVQGFIDSRFYRRKYDAQKTLSAFSATLREEVDLDALAVELLNVVEETMQPAHVSLWMKPAGDRRNTVIEKPR
jgi:K+-sensing histidine kinase KdpD